MGATAAATGMELQYEFEFHAMLKPPLEIGPGPLGTRVFFEATEGEVTGERLSGRLLTGGGDWLLVGPDGWGLLDVRAQLTTDDGAVIYLQYLGILEMNDKVQQALTSEKGTDYGDHYFRTNPRFETGSAKYAWMNRTLFVGEGHIRP